VIHRNQRIAPAAAAGVRIPCTSRPLTASSSVLSLAHGLACDGQVHAAALSSRGIATCSVLDYQPACSSACTLPHPSTPEVRPLFPCHPPTGIASAIGHPRRAASVALVTSSHSALRRSHLHLRNIASPPHHHCHTAPSHQRDHRFTAISHRSDPPGAPPRAHVNHRSA
jgi:hypothetical protein